MCTASRPKVQRSAPPPMVIPETVSETTIASRDRERRRAAAAHGRESTMLGGQVGGPPTGQAKSLLGT